MVQKLRMCLQHFLPSTVMSNLQLASFPAASVATYIIVNVEKAPMSKFGLRLDNTLATPTLSVNVGSFHVTSLKMVSVCSVKDAGQP